MPEPAYRQFLEQTYGLPTGLLASTSQVESGGNPLAVSPAGAVGEYQFMPATARQYGINPRDPVQAATGAARYYRELLDQHGGNLDLALASYNWGPGNVQRQGMAKAPAETRAYLTKVKAAMASDPVIDRLTRRIYGSERGSAASVGGTDPATLEQLMGQIYGAPAPAQPVRSPLPGATAPAQPPPLPREPPIDSPITPTALAGNTRITMDIVKELPETTPDVLAGLPAAPTFQEDTTASPSTLERVARVPVLAGQEFIKGLTLDLAGMPADLANLYLRGVSGALRAVGVDIPPPAEVPGGSQQLEQWYTQALPDALGIPRPIAPTGEGERILSRGARAIGGALSTRPFLPGASTAAQDATLAGTAGVVGGITEEVTGSPGLGAVAQVGTALAPLAFRGGQALLRRTPPGQLAVRTDALDDLAKTTQATNETLDASKQAMQQRISDSKTTMDTELLQLQAVREHTRQTIAQYEDEIHTALAARKTQQAETLMQSRKDSREALTALRVQEEQMKAAHQAQLAALADASQRELQAAQQTALGTRQAAATSAREYVKRLPVPTDDEIRALYQEVDTYKFLMPTDLLRTAQAQVGKTVETVKKFFPQAGMGEMARMAAPGPGMSTPIAGGAAGADVSQDLLGFIRGHKGIRLEGEELAGELRALASPKEAGTTGLMNSRSGISLQTMAERAAEARLIPTADKTALLQAMDRALTRPPSPADTAMVDELGDFFDRMGGQADTLPGEMNFQEAHSLLKWLGQRIGSLQKATTPDAGEQLGSAKSLYAALQRTLDRAADDATVPAQGLATLRAANAAHKVQRTTEALADVIERYITDGKFNAVGMADYLRKGSGDYLRQRLFETGQLESITHFLARTDQEIKDAAAQLGSTRLRSARVRRATQGDARAQEAALRQQEDALRQAAEDTAERIQAEGTSAILPLEEQAAEVSGMRDVARLRETSLAGTVRARQATDETAARAGFTREERTAQQALAQQEAAVPGAPWVPPLYMSGGAFGASWAYQSITGMLLTAPIILARALMTPPGQVLVRKLLAANGGTMTEGMLRTLAATVVREAERQTQPGEERQ